MARERLFGFWHAFDDAFTIWVVVAVAGLLVLVPTVILLLGVTGRMGASSRRDALCRYRSWLLLTPLFLVPVLAGAAWTIAAVTILSLLCYREYERATGLFRERVISLTVVVGILLTMFAVVDHWYGFFVALFPLVFALIATVAVLADRPDGYIQRVALGVLGYMLFGCALGHLAYMANDAHYRPILLLLLLSVELNDIFAYCSGKAFGRRKLTPVTSPNKTLGGFLGSLILTVPLVAILTHFVYRGTALDAPVYLVLFGLIVAVSGTLGDLVISSIKRDLGIKDMGNTLPGFGGLLDRFDSLILIAPAAFHYLGFFVGFGLDQPMRIITGEGP